MKISLTTEAASREIQGISGELALSNFLLFAALALFVAFAVIAMLLLSRNAGAGGVTPAPKGPGETPADGRGTASRWWTIAGVILTTAAVGITFVGLLHHW